MSLIKSFRELRVYQNAMAVASDIYRITQAFPKEERYGVTSQIRRSSRSVCANLAEAWRRRRYERHLRSKLADCAAEADETRVWLDIALDCGLIDGDTHGKLDTKVNQVIGQLVRMESNSEKWVLHDSAQFEYGVEAQ